MDIKITIDAPGLTSAIHALAEALQNQHSGVVDNPLPNTPDELKVGPNPTDKAKLDAADKEAEKLKEAAAERRKKREAKTKADAAAAKAAAEEAEKKASAEVVAVAEPEPETEKPATDAYSLEKVRELISDYSSRDGDATRCIKAAFADLGVRKLPEVDEKDFKGLLETLGLI